MEEYNDIIDLVSDRTAIEIKEKLNENEVRQEDTGITRRFYLGAGTSLYNTYKRGNLDEFWQMLNNDPSELVDNGSSGFFVFKIGLLLNPETLAKNWLGAEVQLLMTNSHAIWGTNLFYGGRNEVYYSLTSFNIVMPYKRALDEKSNVLLVIEPGFDMGFMNGKISTTTGVYDQAFTVGPGGHIATGMDLIIARSINVWGRVGYRILKVNEMHANPSSTTGYSSFYVNGLDGETVKVDWSGLFLSIGLDIMISLK